MSNSGVPDMLLTWHFLTVLFNCCICVFIPTTVLNGQVLFAIFALLPARNRSPFKYHCDHLDASLYVKIA
jgi:hypothetical protein